MTVCKFHTLSLINIDGLPHLGENVVMDPNHEEMVQAQTGLHGR